MNFKKIIIYEYDTLFNILNEIKENLNFDIIKANNKDFKKLKDLSNSDSLIISKSKKENLNNFFLIENIPIKIDQLIQQINIQFLKKKFNFQSDFFIGSYKLNLNSREISKNDKTIFLTEREINLILFLKKKSSAVKINELQKEVWSYGSKLDTHTVETHIYRLRKKIKDKFDDDKFILSSKEGYLIN